MGRLFVDQVGHPVTCVRFTKDRRCISVGSLDSKVRLFDKITGELLNEYSGHLNNNYKIDHVTSNNDQFVLSGSEDNRIYCWDLVRANLVLQLEGHTGSVLCLSYHKDEVCLVSGSSDSTIRVWK